LLSDRRALRTAATKSSHAPGRASIWRAQLTARTCGLAVALVLASAPLARADATVVVEVKRPDGSSADGVVQLTQGANKLRCTTTKGRCEIKGVAGGAYTVELEQAGRPASKPKTVMIPPSGEVKLIVAAT
jgi:hypothetical protein